mgnify:CR=1 FL=1
MPPDQAYIRSKDVENRASFGQRLLWRLEVLGWILMERFLLCLSPEAASNFGAFVMRRLGPFLSQHKVALDNVQKAFPDWTHEKVKATAVAAWENVGRTAGELPHLRHITPYRTNSRIEVVNAEALDQVEQSQSGAVFISGHFANWEVMAAVICRRPVDCLITYRAINNPHIDRRLSRLRHDYGIQALAPKGLGTRSLMKALQAGRSAAFLNDQKFREGLAIPFFARPAMTAPGPARLAIKYNVPIIPVSTVRVAPARFRVTIHDPIIPPATGKPEEDLTQTVTAITEFIEARVREHPDQWFWMHRRWPKVKRA